MTVFYGQLASLWPLISPVEDYADEAAQILSALRERAPGARTLLDLGSGGGHVAYHIKHALECHLTDVSEPMLDGSRRLNPECAHSVGDMRTLDLGQTFDLVLAHDAIDYMTSEDDLRAVFHTAWRHLAPGGVACFIPDDLADTYEAGTEVSGIDSADGRAVRLFEWSEPVVPDRCTVVVHYTFLVRDQTGQMSTYYEPHTTGLFPRATWERLLSERGFSVEVVAERTDEDRAGRLMFVARKPAGEVAAPSRGAARSTYQVV
jgi:SAM-dependent methyltransferase